ncbi:MAG TPA: ribonuclease Z [Candidatus Nanoarchaeia archaeon]|nr:ribonuclease Z [Candidatus Nanoarchaeia archaeon]
MKVTFLGTSCMMPTKERNHPGFLLSYKNENILVDCGENIQRQIKVAGMSPTKITKILLSHWHGDHVFGLPGLLQSLIGHQYHGVLEIYGPKGTKRNFGKMVEAFPLRGDLLKIKITEVNQGKFFENNDFYIEAAKMQHGIECLAYAFKEKDRRRINIDKLKKFGIKEGPIVGDLQKGKDIKFNGKKIKAKEVTYTVPGKKIVFVLDTYINDNCYKIAKDADLLISECTYMADDKEKAKEKKHLTTIMAAGIAKKAKAKRLILTHFSQRYKDAKPMENEARKIFKNVQAAEDFLEVTI